MELVAEEDEGADGADGAVVIELDVLMGLGLNEIVELFVVCEAKDDPASLGDENCENVLDVGVLMI